MMAKRVLSYFEFPGGKIPYPSLLCSGSKGFSSAEGPLSNLSAGTGLPVKVESAGASSRYHTQDGRHLGEAIL